MKAIAVGEYVLIRRKEATDRLDVGVIISAGGDSLEDLNEGNTVLFRKGKSIDVVIDEEALVVVHQEDILVIL